MEIINKFEILPLGNCMRIIFVYMLFLNDEKNLCNNLHSGVNIDMMKNKIS